MPIPEITIAEICPIDRPIKLLETQFEHGGVTETELEILARLADHFAPKNIFEIGTFNGRTTLNFAANTPESTKIFTLDLPPAAQADACELAPDPNDAKYMALRTFGSHFRDSEYSGKITRLFGDSARFDFSPWKGQIDLFFVDGAHSYDYAISDTTRAMELTHEPGSIILWHDYRTKWEGVTSALDHLYESQPGFSGLRNIAGTSLVCLRR